MRAFVFPKTPWRSTPPTRVVSTDYGEALCLSGDFEKARDILKSALVGCEALSKVEPGMDRCILRCHIALSYTLAMLEVDPDDQKQ